MNKGMWLCVLGVGCSTTTTHLTSPHALEPKHMEFTGAYSGQLNTVVLDKSLQSAKVLYEQSTEEGREMTEEEFRGLLDTTLAWSLLTPGTSYELMGRIGVTDKILEGIDVKQWPRHPLFILPAQGRCSSCSAVPLALHELGGTCSPSCAFLAPYACAPICG